MVLTTSCASPLGELLLAEEAGALIGLWLEGQKYYAAGLPEDSRTGDCALFEQARRWLERYFAGERPDIGELPLRPNGSEFSRGVWQLLREIPYGGVTTYGALAAQLAARQGLRAVSARAVGGAVGRNPISPSSSPVTACWGQMGV